MNVVWAREPIPAGPSVFLAGPTPRSIGVPSWRPAAIDALAELWGDSKELAVLSPESRHSIRAADYHDQVDWEIAALDAASAILFWIPRDVATMPAFTTNVEFGLYVGSGKAVLGCPPDCPNPERSRYLIWTARRFGVPVFDHLGESARCAVQIAAAGLA